MKQLYISILFLLFTCGYSFAQQEATTFDVDGVKVIFKPAAKTMVCAKIYFRGGVADYSTAQSGIARITMSALLNCGTKNYTAMAFKDSADKYSIRLTPGAAYDYSSIELNCLYKYFDMGWQLFSDAVKNPVFDDTQLDLLKNKVISSTKSADADPVSYTNSLALKNAFDGTAYAVDPDGNENSIAALNVADLKDYYAKILNKNRMFIVVVGNIGIDELTQKIKLLVEGLPTAPYQQVALTAPLMNDNKTVVEPRNIPTDYVVGVINAPKITSPDYLPFELALRVFGGYLFSVLRTNHNLSYSQGARMVDRLMPHGFVYVTTTEPKDAVTMIVNAINRMKTLELSSRSMNRIRNNYITSNYMTMQSTSAIANNLGTAEVMGGWYYFETIPASVDGVSADQITAAFAKYIVGVRWAFVGKPEHAKDAADAFKLPVK